MGMPVFLFSCPLAAAICWAMLESQLRPHPESARAPRVQLAVDRAARLPLGPLNQSSSSNRSVSPLSHELKGSSALLSKGVSVYLLSLLCCIAPECSTCRGGATRITSHDHIETAWRPRSLLFSPSQERPFAGAKWSFSAPRSHPQLKNAPWEKAAENP